jgi:hypothetical protein
MPRFTCRIVASQILAFALVLLAQGAAQAPAAPAAELVRRAVQNEVNANGQSAKFMFRDRKQTPRGSQTKLMVETRDAMAGIIVAFNDRPLDAQARQAEFARIQRFISDPEELRHKQKQEKEDTERIGGIVKALPDAFLYEYDGIETGTTGLGKESAELLRLKFRPNPQYSPPSRVEQVLTGMQGTLLIDAHQERIAKIDGTLFKDVGFGWGILGHLDHGGRFVVEQGEVDRNHWEITRMDLAFTGKLLLFKSLNIKSTEVYSDFHPVPANLTFAQGVELLRKQEATLAGNHHQDGGEPPN